MPDIEVGGKALVSQSGTADPVIQSNVNFTGVINSTATGTFSGTNTGTISGTISSLANFPAGHIIQTKLSYDYGQYSTASTTFQKYISFSFDNSITSGNQVYIYVNGISSRGTFNSNWGGRLTIFRDNVNLGDGNWTGVGDGRALNSICSNDMSNSPFIMQHIDTTPTVTTTTPTYYVAIAEMVNGSSTNYLGWSGSNVNYGLGRTTMLLMEIQI